MGIDRGHLDESLIDTLKTHLSKQPIILEIGFGKGEISFELLHKINPQKIVGFEADTLENIEKLIHSDESDENLDFFKNYKRYIESIRIVPYQVKEFESLTKFIFDKKFEISSTENIKFDLVVIYKVLHYHPEKEQEILLEKAKSVTANNGFVLLRINENQSHWKHKYKVDIKKISELLDSDFDQKFVPPLVAQGGDVIYFGQKKLR